MNILIFYQYFGTPAGSWSTRMYEFTRRWVKEGHSVTVVTAPYEKSDIKASGFISRTQIEGVNLIIINSGDSNRDSFSKRAMKALLFSMVSVYIALREQCDIVLASSGPITVGIPALFAKWIRRKKMVFEIRDLWPQGAIELGKIRNKFLERVALWFEKLCYQNSSLVIACSPGMEQSVNKRYPSVKTTLIPNASDTELFNSLSKEHFILPEKFKTKKIFVYAGSLGLMDHGMLMIDAMKLITNPKIHLLIIGDGVERKPMEAATQNAGLNNIHFLGLIPKHDVVNWLKSAEAALVLFKDYAVLQTSSPNKLFDAFAAGIPVVQNTTGWIKELFEVENCGVNILPDNVVGLAEAIQSIAIDINYRNEMAHNSKRLAESQFNRNILAKKYLESIINTR